MGVWTVFLLLLAVAQSQRDFPYISFMGDILPNHAFVDLELVGTTENNSVICHTDLPTCCTSAQGPDRGDWYFPDGAILPPANETNGSVYEVHLAQQVQLGRGAGSVVPGIYYCNISTNATNAGPSTNGEIAYVGLYSTGGNITIPNDMMLTVNSDLNGPNPQFTLTCISTGGPATTVAWTRDSTNVTQGAETVLNDPATAQYTHTLTVTGRLGGLYTCTVANEKPSSASSSFDIEVASAPTDLTAVQEGPTSIAISWRPPSPLGNTTEYRIFYTGATGSSSANVSTTGSSFFSEGSGSGALMESEPTDDYTLTGLRNGDTYSISVIALSEYLPSDIVTLDRNVSLFPSQPALSPTSPTETSVSFSWTVDTGSVVDNYLVAWQRDPSVGCPGEEDGGNTLPGNSTNASIPGLEEDSQYSFTLSASNAAGSVSISGAAMTLEAAPSAPPREVTASISGSNITVRWENVECIHRNGNLTGYIVQYMEVASQMAESLNVSAGRREETLSGLSPATTYVIKVAAVNRAGVGRFSDAITLRSSARAPVLVVESQSDAFTVSLSWTSAGSEAGSYLVVWQRDTGVGCLGEHGGNATVAITSYTLTRLSGASSYTVSVTAFIGTASVAVSEELVIQTTEAAPTAPVGFVNVSNVTRTSFTLHWGPVPCIHRNGIITGYLVMYGIQGTERSQSLRTTNGNVLSANIVGLLPDFVYRVEIAGVNSVGAGVSTFVDVRTSQAVPETESESSLSAPVVGGGAAGGAVVLLLILILVVIVVVYLVRKRGRNYIPELRSKLSTTADDLHMREFAMPGKYTQTTIMSNEYINVGKSAEIDRSNEPELSKQEILEKDLESDRYVSVVESSSQSASRAKETEGYVKMRPLAVPIRETLVDKGTDTDGYIDARVLDSSQPSTPEKEAGGYISARALDGSMPSTPEKEAGDGYVDARILDNPDKELGGVKKSLAMENEYVTMRSQTTLQPGNKKKTDSYKPARTATLPANSTKRDSEAEGYDTVRTFATLRPSTSPRPAPKNKKKAEESGPTADGYEISRPFATSPPKKLTPKGKVEDEDESEDDYENSRPLASSSPPKLLPKGKVEDEDLPEDGYENSRPLAAPSPSPELTSEDEEEDGYENSRPLAKTPPPKLPPKPDDDGLPEDGYENSRLLPAFPATPPPPKTEETASYFQLR